MAVVEPGAEMPKLRMTVAFVKLSKHGESGIHWQSAEGSSLFHRHSFQRL